MYYVYIFAYGLKGPVVAGRFQEVYQQRTERHNLSTLQMQETYKENNTNRGLTDRIYQL